MHSQDGIESINNSCSIAPMDPQQPPRRIPKIKFRVLIIGRANAGKTSILQRVCDTTDSPIIYRGNEKITLEPSINVSDSSTSLRLPLNVNPARRAHH
ncbi:hypothetical protein EDB92DRAFT_1845570 [Lactarius akahatsu]|uniref:G domain-containing protein n=1 Tax=Lactarius akahatsu TaxID=416441 RepID=A0AAD4QFN4_9AGAM|nr:hypothetical protein EDB92DRAFT_1845570 [Lactarius akahatsu]